MSVYVYRETYYPNVPGVPRSAFAAIGGYRNGRKRPPNSPHSSFRAAATFSHPERRLDAPNSEAAGMLVSDGYEDGLARNKALSAFAEEISKSAELGAAVVEGRDSLSMIANRAFQLVDALRHLRRGNLPGMAKTLRVSVLGKHRKLNRRKVTQNAGKLWLEYWFGWAPLLSDIHTAARVLVQDQPAARLKVRKTVRSSYERNLYLPHEDIPPWGQVWQWKFDILRSCELEAEVYVGNSDVALANKLGVLNPAAVAWALVPYSWLVDWFIPVGEAINQFTWFSGYELRNQRESLVRIIMPKAVQRSKWWEYYIKSYSQEGVAQYDLRPVTDVYDLSGVYFTRSDSFPSYMFNLSSKFNRLSVTRAATAISLLVQHLSDISPKGFSRK